MGTWGTGLFSDDTALDVRSDYRNALGDGLDGPTATDKVLSLYHDVVDDPDEGPSVWLALAATQWQYGRLEQRVLDRALAIIDNGSDIARFSEEASLRRGRSRVLERLRQKLSSPQPAPKKMRPKTPFECDWEPGEIVGFRRDSGEWLALHVEGIVTTGRDRYPVVSILDMPFDQVDEATSDTPVRQLKQRGRFGPLPDGFHIIGLKKRDLKSERIRRSAKFFPPRINVDGFVTGTWLLPWKGLDGRLATYLDDAPPAAPSNE